MSIVLECAKKYSKRRGFILKPDYSAAGKAYFQLSNIYLENGELLQIRISLHHP